MYLLRRYEQLGSVFQCGGVIRIVSVFDSLLFLCSVDELLPFHSPGTNPIEYNWYVNNWAVLHCLSLDNSCVVWRATVLEIKQILPSITQVSKHATENR